MQNSKKNMQEKLHKRLHSYIDNKINLLSKKLRLYQTLFFSLKTLVFLLNIVSFSLALYVLINSYDSLVNIKDGLRDNSFKDWTLLLTICLILSFLVNISLIVISPLRKTENYKRLLDETKYLWFKSELDPNYTLEMMEKDIKEAEGIHLSKRQVKQRELLRLLILGEREKGA